MSTIQQPKASLPAGAQQTGEVTATPQESLSEVLRSLSVDPAKGLSAVEAKSRLEQYGPNALVEKQESLLAKILGHFAGPIAYMGYVRSTCLCRIGHKHASRTYSKSGIHSWSGRQHSSAYAPLSRAMPRVINTGCRCMAHGHVMEGLWRS